MIRMPLVALLAATALSTPALAQTAPNAATSNETPTTGESPAADAIAALPTAEEAASQAEFLQAQVEALQAQIEALKKTVAVNAPQWKGMPQLNGDGGWSFKPKGFVQFDAGTVENPSSTAYPAGAFGAPGTGKSFGFNARGRRFVFGAEGTMPGGFGYKVEFDFAQSGVNYEDIVLTWNKAGTPFGLTIGNFYPLSGLETMTSSRVTSFLERAQLTAAFGASRRLGAAVALTDPADQYTLTAGVFTRPINNATFTQNQWQASIRGTWAPTFGPARVHLGANYQHRETSSDNAVVSYAAGQLTTINNNNFIATGNIPAKSEDIAGVELGGILKAFYVAGEGQWARVNSYASAAAVPARVLVPTAATGFYVDKPSFFSGYAEVGFFLTGESRGYKGGKWDRTKVLKPFDKGGWGLWQLAARYDYTDLTDRVGTSAATTTGNANFAAPFLVNGGKQDAYQVALAWQPIDYVRFIAQYTHDVISGGPNQRAVGAFPAATLNSVVNAEDFNVNSFAMRAQIDF